MTALIAFICVGISIFFAFYEVIKNRAIVVSSVISFIAISIAFCLYPNPLFGLFVILRLITLLLCLHELKHKS